MSSFQFIVDLKERAYYVSAFLYRSFSLIAPYCTMQVFFCIFVFLVTFPCVFLVLVLNAFVRTPIILLYRRFFTVVPIQPPILVGCTVEHLSPVVDEGEYLSYVQYVVQNYETLQHGEIVHGIPFCVENPFPHGYCYLLFFRPSTRRDLFRDNFQNLPRCLDLRTWKFLSKKSSFDWFVDYVVFDTTTDVYHVTPMKCMGDDFYGVHAGHLWSSLGGVFRNGIQDSDGFFHGIVKQSKDHHVANAITLSFNIRSELFMVRDCVFDHHTVGIFRDFVDRYEVFIQTTDVPVTAITQYCGYVRKKFIFTTTYFECDRSLDCCCDFHIEYSTGLHRALSVLYISLLTNFSHNVFALLLMLRFPSLFSIVDSTKVLKIIRTESA